MNVTDDLEPTTWDHIPAPKLFKYVFSDGQYIATHLDGNTTEITVKPGASMTIWTQSTIERVE